MYTVRSGGIMIILHNMTAQKWNSVKNNSSFGDDQLETEGFLHCSPLYYWHRVAVRFDNDNTDMVLLLIDTDKLTSPVKWEDGSRGMGYMYPHVYGVINISAVVDVLPYLRNDDGTWKKNAQLLHVIDR